jgi:hypothetical protein
VRYVPLHYDVLNAAGNAETAREAEWRELHRRPDALPLPPSAEAAPRLSVAWLTRLSRRRPAARASRAAG